MRNYKDEIKAGERFQFGANWKFFLKNISQDQINYAENEIKDKLEVENLNNRTFLDIGSGSGLSSLAAKKLGAKVYSFDYDLESVECTRSLKKIYFADDKYWEITNGSILDKDFIKKFGKFNIVYSWGVLHHTGRLWEALENTLNLVEKNGILFIAIYNDMGVKSKRWLIIKKLYNQLPFILRWIVFIPAFLKIWLPVFIKDFLKLKPLYSWMNYSKKESRGFKPFTDAIDWIGGYPYEFAKPEEIYNYCFKRGFILLKLKTCGGGMGCNEYIFKKI